KKQRPSWPTWMYVSLVVILLFESVFCIKLAIPNLSHINVDNRFYPIQAVKLLSKSGVTGNIALEPMGWGEYVIWHLSPNLKVSYDGRRETVYNKENRALNLDFMNGVNGWNQILLNYAADLVLVEQGRPTINLMKLDRDWQLAYEDKICA